MCKTCNHTSLFYEKESCIICKNDLIKELKEQNKALQIDNDVFQQAIKDNAKLEKLTEVQMEYYNLLNDELKEVAGLALSHRWKSTRVEKGQELRDKIAKLRE